MFVQVDETPNPETLKFTPGKKLINVKPIEFLNPEDAKMSPFILDIFKIEGVCSVYLSFDFLTVTKKSSYEWAPLKTLILSSIVDSLGNNKLILPEDILEGSKSNKEISSVEKEIIELLESKVRPAVASHGGDIVFHSFDNGIVELELQGSCSGCPSSLATLKMGVENMLKHYIPDVKEVREKL